MSQSNPKYFLRPEAGPVPYGKLQRRATNALKDIIGFLSAAVTSAQLSGKSDSTDRNRASRIFFVSGEPGSGKSTLYLTLKEMLSDKDGSEEYREGCKLDLNELKGGVRWLDTLDLEVAGDDGENLLAAVLVRVIEVLTDRDTISNTIHSKPCEGAIKDLEELANDIGIAWEGNLQARAGKLDPDTFSEEVMRTQRARLRVNERLKKALDELAKNGCYGCNERTVFVLPVDDFYLKPDASLQLLRLLRMISIPRLFFLVMGDIKTIEALFVEKSLADWTAVAGAELFTALPERLGEAVARARELRARYLRKLLPPGQRAIIEAMDWDEALKFRPQQLDGKGLNIKTLKSLLRDEKLDSATESAPVEEKENQTNLLDFLVWPPFEDKKTNKAESKDDSKKEKENHEEEAQNRKAAQEAYTALQILDATSREIMDLWFKLHNPDIPSESERSDIPRQLLVVEDFVRLVIEEQDFLNEEEQANLSGVLPTRHYSRRDIQFNMDRLSLEPDPNSWSKVINDESGQQLWVRPHRSWKLATKTDDGESRGDTGLFAKLPPRQAAWIILLHDLAWKWDSRSVTGNLVNRLIEDLVRWSESERKASSKSEREDRTEVQKITLLHLTNLVALLNKDATPTTSQLHADDDFQGWAVWQSGSSYKHLPLPPLSLFRELDRFLLIWSSGLEWLDKVRNQACAIQEQAQAARTKADEARNRFEAAKKGGESDDVLKEAETAKGEAEIFATQKQAEADEAQGRVGVTKPQQMSKFIYLWGLASSSWDDNSYEQFANRKDGWFETELKNFENLSSEASVWRKEIGKFEQEVLGPGEAA